MNNEQTQQAADDPSGDGWRDVEPSEILQPDDMFETGGKWTSTANPGLRADEGGGGRYRRRIQPQQQAETNPDDPNGPGWRDVLPSEILHVDDMVERDNGWGKTRAAGIPAGYQRYRRRIQPQQSSDSEATPDHDRKGERQENNEQTRRIRLLERAADALEEFHRRLDAALKSNERLEQERKEASRSKAELERAVQRYQNQLTGAQEQVERLSRELLATRDRGAKSLAQSYNAGCDAAISTIEKWLSPVVGLMAEEPEDCGPLATVLLGYLPQIVLRLIEEKRQ